MTRHKLVTVATSPNSVVAHLVRQELGSAGVRCFINDDNMVSTYWALGGVKLQVDETDACRAVAVLDALHPVVAAAKADGEASGTVKAEGNERSRLAERAWRAALIGIGLLPAQVYASWLLLKVYDSEEPLSEQARRQMVYASLINLPYMVFALFLALLGVVTFLGH